MPGNTRTGPQIEEAARAGDPEAGLSLTRDGVSGSKEERGVPTGIIGKNKSVREAARLDRLVSSYKAIAARLGKLLKGDGIPEDAKLIGGGVEHQVYRSGDRVYKLTKPNEYGRATKDTPSDPVSYMERLSLQNKIFGDDLRWEGINETGQTVTSQSYIHPTELGISRADVFAFMDRCGFEPATKDEDNELWSNKEGVIVGDTHPGNFIKDSDGNLHPIDLLISSGDTAEEMIAP